MNTVHYTDNSFIYSMSSVNVFSKKTKEWLCNCLLEDQSAAWQFLEQYLTNLQPEQRGSSSPTFIQLAQILRESTSVSDSKD